MYLKSSHATKATNSVAPAVREELVSCSHSLTFTRPNTFTTQLSAIITAMAMRTATRMQRATTSGSFGAALAGVRPASFESRRRTKACMSVSKISMPTTRFRVSTIADPTCTEPETAP